MIRHILDHQKQSHTLNLDAVQVDGKSIVEIQADGDYVLFETGSGTVTCLLEQIWQQVAGPDLSAREAGALLMECLARQILLDRQQAILCDLSQVLSRLGDIEITSASLNWLTTRLDPLARQAMRAYDGSDAMTEALTRILDQTPATIQSWALELGLDTQTEVVTGASKAPVPEPVIAAPADESRTESTATRTQFSWTQERRQQLEQALETCNAPTVAERARLIAAQYGWPEQVVRSKLYERQRPGRGEGLQQPEREAESTDRPQLEDQPVRSLPSSQVIAPLAQGNFLWTVQCAGEALRWRLDYPYGTFPFARGQRVRVANQEYRVEHIANSLIRVVAVSPVLAQGTVDRLPSRQIEVLASS